MDALARRHLGEDDRERLPTLTPIAGWRIGPWEIRPPVDGGIFGDAVAALTPEAADQDAPPATTVVLTSFDLDLRTGEQLPIWADRKAREAVQTEMRRLARGVAA